MDEDDDDLYNDQAFRQENGGRQQYDTGEAQGSEEGEEYEDSVSDIDIITEKKPEARTEPTGQPTRPDSTKPHQERQQGPERTVKRETTSSGRAATAPRTAHAGKPGTDFPEIRTSDIKFDEDPSYEPAGRPLTSLDIDNDLAEHTKPWRLPGSDQSDYFNYGFDEFTWGMYCMRQKAKREEVGKEKSNMDMFGMPGAGPGSSEMPGLEQMQQFMQMMSAGQMPQGMDPSMFGGNMQPMPGAGFNGGPEGSNMGPMDGGNAGGSFRGRRGRGRW